MQLCLQEGCVAELCVMVTFEGDTTARHKPGLWLFMVMLKPRERMRSLGKLVEARRPPSIIYAKCDAPWRAHRHDQSPGKGKIKNILWKMDGM